MTAALVMLACAGVQAQTSSFSRYSLTVPQVLSITTTPTNANFAYTLTGQSMVDGQSLQTVTWNVKSNGNWKASTMWSVFGLSSNSANSSLLNASVTNFRNALKYSTDNGSTWNPVSPNIGAQDPIPGYGNMAPTSASGHEVIVLAKLDPTAYNVIPGTYVATTIVTVTAL